MSYVLDLRPPVPDAVRDVALERLDRAIGELSGERSPDVATAVHEARKDLKKLRSLVRLLRPGLPRKTYRREADALREVSRGLGARREADALVETVDALRDPAAGRVPATAMDALREAFADRTSPSSAGDSAGAAVPSAGSGDDFGAPDLSAAVTALRAVRERVADGALAVDGRSALAAGLARSYDRAHEAFAGTAGEPTAEDLHEWRKRVKVAPMSTLGHALWVVSVSSIVNGAAFRPERIRRLLVGLCRKIEPGVTVRGASRSTRGRFWTTWARPSACMTPPGA